MRDRAAVHPRLTGDRRAHAPQELLGGRVLGDDAPRAESQGLEDPPAVGVGGHENQPRAMRHRPERAQHRQQVAAEERQFHQDHVARRGGGDPQDAARVGDFSDDVHVRIRREQAGDTGADDSVRAGQHDGDAVARRRTTLAW